MSDTINPYLGIGVYSVPEAALFLHTSAQKLRRWADGYTFVTAAAETRASPALFARDFPELVAWKILTFEDLIELKWIAALRNAGLSMPYIRRVSEWAKEQLGVSHPFATRRFVTDGAGLWMRDGSLARKRADAPLRQALSQQFALRPIVDQFLIEIEYEGDLARRLWPMGQKRRVVLDPKRNFGKPIDSPTGVPTFPLAQMVEGGTSEEKVAWWYGIPPRAVREAVEFERSLRPPN